MRLQELAARVALDVDDHSSHVEDVNYRLSVADEHDPAMIVNVVAKLIQVNEQMHQKLALSEDRLREQAQAMEAHVAEARTDALTLLANRRAFDDEIARRTAEFIRQGRTFSLIMADVDHFKKFNDTYGHPMGDEVLRGMAKLLRRKMREMDLVARYGGEEFTVIMPGTKSEEAGKAALRACEALERHCFNHEGKEVQVTASFGVAEVSLTANGAAIVGRADRALYAAKNDGRNCVYLDDGANVRRVVAHKPPSSVAPTAEPPATADPAQTVVPETLASKVKADERQPQAFLTTELHLPKDLPSRTAFCQQVRNRTAEWQRGGPTFSVLLLEANQYEEGGGEHGQRVRDFVIRSITRYLAATIREMDVVGHYAPGCFALMLPTAGLPDAIRVAERLREGFAQSSQVASEDRPRLSLSVGVVQVVEGDDSISLLKRAEAALDAADRRGGNRAYYHDGERCAPITAMLETMDYLS